MIDAAPASACCRRSRSSPPVRCTSASEAISIRRRYLKAPRAAPCPLVPSTCVEARVYYDPLHHHWYGFTEVGGIYDLNESGTARTIRENASAMSTILVEIAPKRIVACNVLRYTSHSTEAGGRTARVERDGVELQAVRTPAGLVKWEPRP
jgi:hypothetical protein